MQKLYLDMKKEAPECLKESFLLFCTQKPSKLLGYLISDLSLLLML